MLEHKRFLYSTLKWRIIMYHELPDHSSAPLLRNLDKNLNQYNALACNRESGWDFEGSDIWRILQGLPEFSRNTAFPVATTFIVKCRIALPYSPKYGSASQVAPNYQYTSRPSRYQEAVKEKQLPLEEQWLTKWLTQQPVPQELSDSSAS